MVSRAFDSFDCSTDDCTTLIVSSRKPVERLSIPFRFSRPLSPKTTSATAPNQNCAKHHRGSFDSFDCYFITFGAVFQPFVIGMTPPKKSDLRSITSLLSMGWYPSRMSRTRSFDSFYCSTDGFIALIVSSRKPIEWLSIPFSTHSIVRLCPFYL